MSGFEIPAGEFLEFVLLDNGVIYRNNSGVLVVEIPHIKRGYFGCERYSTWLHGPA